MSPHVVEMMQVTKDYGGTIALDRLNLYIRKNEFLTLLGPSGCGKTTTLRLIGGFERPSEGTILMQGKDVTNLPPHKRKVNTVFQNYALFPHMNVFENIAFGLRIKKLDAHLIKKKVGAILELVNLPGFETRTISSLSGGQQQRVAIARALVNEPELLLLDEPLGALDLKLRKEMQVELKTIQKELGITFVFVTHDQEEALSMSDTIAVMNFGTIQQIGTPEDIYNEPKNAFVADFIGESNIILGVMKKDKLVSFCGQDFPCLDGGFSENEEVDVVIRPEDVNLVPKDTKSIQGTVKSITFLGVHYEMILMTNEIEWLVHSTQMERVGTVVGLDFGPNDIHIMKKVKPS